tara:strand:- start:1083 stop:1253 length:171 start_codon:yes stop_codon:yes gene_type:complete
MGKSRKNTKKLTKPRIIQMFTESKYRLGDVDINRKYENALTWEEFDSIPDVGEEIC